MDDTKGAEGGKAGSQGSQGADAVADWVRHVATMNEQARGVDWSKVDWSKLQAKDVGVRFGPIMTEEQFREYRRRQASTQAGKRPASGEDGER